MGGLISAGYFLFSLAFNLLLFVLWARIFLRYFRVSTLHPISQAIHTITNPMVHPFEKLFKLGMTQRIRFDWACLLVIVIVELIKYLLIGALAFGKLMPIGYLILYVFADLIVQPCNLLFYAIIIRVIMSWVNPSWHHPAAEALFLITEPIMRLGRRIIPPIAGFDLSPILILVGLSVITIFVGGLLPVRLM